LFRASFILVLLLEEKLISIIKFATFDIFILLFAFSLASKNIVLKLLLLARINLIFEALTIATRDKDKEKEEKEEKEEEFVI